MDLITTRLGIAISVDSINFMQLTKKMFTKKILHGENVKTWLKTKAFITNLWNFWKILDLTTIGSKDILKRPKILSMIPE